MRLKTDETLETCVSNIYKKHIKTLEKVIVKRMQYRDKTLARYV
jgi:hypothetical protein